MHKIKKFQNPAGPLSTISGLPQKSYIDYFGKTVWPTKSITSVLPHQSIKPLSFSTPKLNTGLEFDKLSKRYSGKPSGVSSGVKSAAFQGIDYIGGMLPSVNDDPTTNAINQGYNAVADIAMSIPGYGQLVGGAMKATDLVNKGLASITGGATTVKNPGTTADKILSSNLFGINPIGIANALTKSKVSGTDKDLAGIAQAYGNVNTTTNKEFGGVSKAWSWLTGSKNKAKQAKNLTNKYNTENALKADVVNKNTSAMNAANNSYQAIQDKNYKKLMGGVGTNILAAKEGLKLQEIVKKAQYLADGGKMNVIPSGALHRELNHLDGDHTKKGIPVLLEEEGGQLTQQAEIEREEIIFILEVTKKLEELYKQYENGNEEAVIEAGKLLTKEILENTIDNTDLLNTVK